MGEYLLVETKADSIEVYRWTFHVPNFIEILLSSDEDSYI